MADTLSMELGGQQQRASVLLDRIDDFLHERRVAAEYRERECEDDVEHYSRRSWTNCKKGEVSLQWDARCNEIDTDDKGGGDPECGPYPERFYEVSVSLGVGDFMVQIHHNDDHGESGWYTDHGDLDGDLATLAARFPDGDLTEEQAFEFIAAVVEYFKARRPRT